MTDRIRNIDKDRRESMGDLTRFLKRKRKGEGGEVEVEREKIEEVFRKSKKTIRSPVKMGEEGGMREWLKEMREEMREGLKGVRKEIREVAEGQKEWMGKEVERIKEEMKEREEKWMREKEEMKERITALERELGERGKGEGNEIWMERLRRLERKSEWREREERKKNIMVRGGRKEKGWMVVVTLGSVEDKGRIMSNKWRMKGRDIWIEEDLTWKERKMS
ncbi:hypothetical protein ALC57_11204 [Trachymyrmex cornetzi]|uniref:Golgin subfamily A member 6-like protein 22 n=1 Tax=Trachymyrmex cornetzi TaxID=471704 RepID=A0A151J2Z9_9HYME|nr:hypothetical protein ALC57_11204 [Trachymyrmex cornetzi]